MSMAGVNPAAAGGPVGGGNMMMMGDGSPMANGSSDQTKSLLNTYIYEYFLKIGMHDVARTLSQQPEKFKINVAQKPSPGQRKGGMDGNDADAMDVDNKFDIPDDLPRPQCPNGSPGTAFLVEWFGIFYDIFQASARKGSAGPAQQYLMHAQNVQRMRENSQNMIRPGMMPNQYAMRANMRNGMVNGAAMPNTEMAKRMTPQQLAMMQQQQQKMQAQQQQQMQREGGDADMNGRPGTPADGDNGGSPSKRPRLEGQQQFNGGMMPNGRPMPNAVPQGMMIQNGFNPQGMNPQFRPNAGMQGQKAPMQPGMVPNGMNMMNNAGSPMMAGMNGGQFGNDAAMEMYQTGRMGVQGQMQGGPAAQSGNHALQDYQMQLMLLEQQNKKRLMMARQEQDNQVQRDGAPMPAMGGTGMSPSGSRSGTSPNPADQMKRTPQIGGMPGSPSAGENMQGRSPAGMNFMNGSMPDGFNPMFMNDKQGMGGPGGPNMRPPTSMNMQGGRMAGQFQGGQPMVQQQSQPGQQPMGTPGPRSEMPPPQAPAGSANRNQASSSPAQSGGNAPPTPSQSNKANPKKKGKDDGAGGNAGGNKKKPNKKNSQANAANDSQTTPAPANATIPAAPAQPMQQPQQMPQPDMSQNASFDFNSADQNFNLDFSTLDNTDVLENFDFDSFLNTSNDDAFNFESGMVGGDFGLDAGGD